MWVELDLQVQLALLDLQEFPVQLASQDELVPEGLQDRLDTLVLPALRDPLVIEDRQGPQAPQDLLDLLVLLDQQVILVRLVSLVLQVLQV